MRALLVAVLTVAVASVVALVAGNGVVHVGGQPITLWIAALCFALNWAAFIPAARWRTEGFYDATGSLTFLAVVAVALGAVVGSGIPLEGARVMPALLVVIWTLRLGAFLVRRVHRAGKDGRFDELKQQPARFFVAWTLQALWSFLTSFAAVLLITKVTPASLWSPTMITGVCVWCMGFGIEVIADAQKAAFAAAPANRGRFIQRGLWAWSRHPNYFGEILLWVGIFMSGVEAYTGGEWIAAISPAFVTLLLVGVSGIPLLEARADARWGTDPAYQAWKQATPVLIPRPPRKSS